MHWTPELIAPSRRRLNDCRLSVAYDVRKNEAITLHDASGLYIDRPIKDRCVVDKGVELTVLSAWVYLFGQAFKELQVEVAPGIRTIEF